MGNIFLNNNRELIYRGNYGNEILLFETQVINWKQSSILFNRTYSRKATLSLDGKYMATTYSSNIYQSDDYGNPTGSTIGPTGSIWDSVGFSGVDSIDISSSGQYRLTCNFGDPSASQVSNDYGVNYSDVTERIVFARSTSVSDTGQYMLTTGLITTAQSYLVSNDYGVSFTKSAGSINYRFLNSDISGDGKYMVGLNWQTTNVSISDDYGVSFNTPVDCGTDGRGISLSQDGKYILVSGTNDCRLSTDYGVTWNTTFSGINGPYYACDMSDSGEIMILGGTIEVFISFNYGQDWHLQTDDFIIGAEVAGVSGDGKYFLIATDEGSGDDERFKVGQR